MHYQQSAPHYHKSALHYYENAAHYQFSALQNHARAAHFHQNPIKTRDEDALIHPSFLNLSPSNHARVKLLNLMRCGKAACVRCA